MITRILIALSFLIIFQSGFSQTNDKSELKKFETEINRILLNLDSIIVNSKNQDNTVVKQYQFVKQKIYKNDLQIVFDSTLTYDFYGNASFNISNENPKDVSISYGKFIVDKYKEFPALIYGVLMNTFQSAYDYYNNQELFLISIGNPIEKTYFEIDAITLEAIFLNVYMKGAAKLGILENFLISDLDNGLNSASFLFKETDLELLHKIDNLKAQDENAETLLNEFNNIGKDLIKNVSFSYVSKWDNYRSIITLKTYVFYSQQVVFDIVHLKKGVKAEMFKLNDYQVNLKTINQIQKIIKDNNSFLKFHKETLKLFGDYYKK